MCSKSIVMRSALRVKSKRMSAVELTDIDSNITVFNEWNGSGHLFLEIVGVDPIEDTEEEE
jgi:hypothetical protein